MDITTKDEKAFIETLWSLFGKKLIFGTMIQNNIIPQHEIRLMSTAGGLQFGMADIDYFNRRHSGIYTRDEEEVYIRAIDIERRSPTASWYLVEDSEHTVDSVY